MFDFYKWLKTLQIQVRAPKFLVSTIRHPAFTPEARLVTGDLTGARLFNAMSKRNRRVRWYNLSWEAHAMNSPNEVALRWGVPMLVGEGEYLQASGLSSIPWWLDYRNLSGYVENVLNDKMWLGILPHLKKVAGGALTDPTLQTRVWSLRKLYAETLTQTGQPLSENTYALYCAVVANTLGSGNIPPYKATPLMGVVSELIRPRLVKIGEKGFQEAISRLCPRGDKNLFLGGVNGDPLRLRYIGWSPKGFFQEVHGDALTGKTHKKPKIVVNFDYLQEEIRTGQIIPIGQAAMFLLVSDSNVLHHGAERGRSTEIAKLGHGKCMSFDSPYDSWPFLILTHWGRSVELNLHEIYVLFGSQNPFILKTLQQSMKSGRPVRVSLKRARQYMA